MEDLKEAKKLEKSIWKVFNKFHNPTNESSEAEALELLISQLPNPAEVRNDDKDQLTLLHHACYNGWYEVAKVLIEKYNCDPNCRNTVGSIPLQLACWGGNLHLVKYLILDKGCDPNDMNSRGLVSLHHTALGGHLDVAKFLFEHCKVEPGCRDSNANTPLHLACKSGHLLVAKYLIEVRKCDSVCKNNNGQTPLYLACLNGHLDVAKYLIEEKQCDPVCRMDDGQTPLHAACWSGHLDVAKYLIEEKQCETVCRRNDGQTQLHAACWNGHLDMAKYLIEEKQCDPVCRRNDGGTPLHVACWNGHLDVAKYLIEEKQCDPVCRTNDGQTPLHLACCNGHLDVAKYLIEEKKCDPVCKMNDGATSLHAACWSGHLDVVKYLIEERQCDPVCGTNDGQTPLHLTCCNGHLDVAKYLIEEKQCDPACRRNNGVTPLLTACWNGHLDVVKYLVEEKQCDPACSVIQDNKNWSIASLHVACFNGHADVTEFLLNKCQSDPMCKDSSGISSFTYALKENHLNIVNLIIRNLYKEDFQYDRTYLHLASIRGDLEIVRFLIEDQHCNSQLKDSEGLTPLHLASKHGYLDIVKYLVISQNCNAVCTANDGSLPSSLAIINNYINIATFLLQNEYGVCDNNLLIHSACREGHIVNIRCLAKNFNPHARDSNGFAPLHIACENGFLEIVKFLIQESNCDPMCMTSDAWIPLHSASQGGNLGVVKYLIEEQQCNQSCRTLKGMTPLHLACKYQHFDIVVYLVNECICADLSLLPYYGDSLMEETLEGGNDDILFFLMSQGLQFTSKYGQISSRTKLVQPALKVFVLGNAMSGKSTLVKALMSNLAEGGWFKNIFNPKVTGVEAHTAGIIPYHAHSPSCGQLVLYDFAGQHEHYSSSHAAILEKLRCAQSDLVLIVVDISRPKEQLVKELKYWDSFVSNQYEQEKPPVIVIGSHYDVAKQQGKQTLIQALSELPHLNVSITLDCTRKSSLGLTEICKQISTYSKNHHENFNVSAQVHFLSRLLQEKFENEITCQLQGVFDLIGHEDNAVLRRNNLLPLTMDALSNQVSKLSEHGQLVYVEDSDDIKLSWLIFKKEVLLSELNGSIFAPKEFETVYKDLSSTGVVALSKVKEAFPHYNCKMLMGFMTTLDFCHKIDKSDLSVINSSDCGDQQIQDQEQYYFFPALVSTDKNTESCQAITKMSYKFGWCLSCKGNIFFTSRFLHVLLLRLAFTFALPAEPSRNENSLAVECRMCNIWKNGIHWQNMNGVETIVEVVEQNTAVVLVMGCLQGSQVKCIQLRSAVIKTILSTKEKYSAAVDIEESCLHPDELVSYPLREAQSLFTFPLSTLRIAVKERMNALINKIGCRPGMINIDTLLFFEPYTCLTEEVIRKLIEGSDQNKKFEDSDDDFLNECAKVAHPKMTQLKEILLLPQQDSEYCTATQERTDQFSGNPTYRCLHIFKTWQKFTQNPTYRGLRDALDSFSIFRGRHPLP